jgi:DNA-binding MarR family transcriptional regulator
MSDPTAGSAAGRDAFAAAFYGLVTLILRRRPRDISLTAASALSTLNRSGPQRLTDLAAIEGVSQPSMTVLVTGLERAGLAERRPSPDDGRVVLVALTPPGANYLHIRRQTGAAVVADLISELSAAEAAALAAAVPAINRLTELDALRTAAATTHSIGAHQ